MKASLAPLAAVTFLAACTGGTSDPVENAAAQLENAADQSDPAAAAVLDNAAEQVLEQNSVVPAQNAMEQAGNAQVPKQPLKRGPGPTPERAPPLPKDGPIQPSEIR